MYLIFGFAHSFFMYYIPDCFGFVFSLWLFFGVGVSNSNGNFKRLGLTDYGSNILSGMVISSCYVIFYWMIWNPFFMGLPSSHSVAGIFCWYLLYSCYHYFLDKSSLGIFASCTTDTLTTFFSYLLSFCLLVRWWDWDMVLLCEVYPVLICFNWNVLCWCSFILAISISIWSERFLS